MNIATEWVFGEIARKNDVSFSGGLYQKKPSLYITRSRVMTGSYTTELDTTQTSLSAYNGGNLTTVEAPNRTILTFGTSQNWINTTDVFIESGYWHNRRPVYVMEYSGRSKYTNQLGMWILPLSTAGSETSFRWYMVEDALSTIFSRGVYADYSASAGGGLVYLNNSSYASTLTINSTDNLTMDGVTLTGSAPFTGASQATIGTGQGSFVCIEDSQYYDRDSVGWYTRRQTWGYDGVWTNP